MTVQRTGIPGSPTERIPIGSMVLLYMVTWIPSIYPSHVSMNIPAPWILWDIVFSKSTRLTYLQYIYGLKSCKQRKGKFTFMSLNLANNGKESTQHLRCFQLSTKGRRTSQHERVRCTYPVGQWHIGNCRTTRRCSLQRCGTSLVNEG